ncbi:MULTISPECIES: polysaccharide biosynthesis/export family protein [Sphingobium]|jgi:polysaccharide export outer membrane protein|uniref:polysaccharide biosynthesis/export family protein n=1 Tax=Sphingobium sp. MI1205 TaxID=407020 RepID=UPI0007701A80|nr:polysaccharide biosynthesis/export family protein [Sphingobium sp. MI1205]AMK19276.1 polysaccharide export outer membrane protein [Sphingobium sp. MI1205]
MRLVQSIGISLMLAVTGCAGSVSGLPAVSTANADQYRLGPGDELRVIVPGLTEIDSGTAFVVNDRGELTLPLMGGIPVRGSTIPELEQRIAALLVEKRLMVSPAVSIQPMRLRPIYILGEVRSPGEYPYRPGMTVVTAVSVAGGYTFRANRNTVAIIRQVDGQASTAKASENTPVQPGDTIKVVEKWF